MRVLVRRLTLLCAATAVLLPAVSSPAEELNWAEKMFSELEHDFGVVARGADVRHRIYLKNLYEETVTIAGVSTTCGCTAAEPSRTVLHTNETAYIEIVMDTKKFMRKKDSNVDVRLTFNDVNTQTVRIPIHAYIRSDVVIQPGRADFGNVSLGEAADTLLKIDYAGRPDWHIKEVRSNREYLRAVARETGRADGRVTYDLTVQLASNTPAGLLNEQLVIVTDDASNPYIPLLATATIEPDIVVATPNVALGDLKPGVEKTVRVIVRGRKPFAIDNIECESNLECFKVKLSHDEKTVHILPLTVTPPAGIGELSEQFTVHIAGRSQPVTFRATGRVN